MTTQHKARTIARTPEAVIRQMALSRHQMALYTWRQELKRWHAMSDACEDGEESEEEEPQYSDAEIEAQRLIVATTYTAARDAYLAIEGSNEGNDSK